MSTAGDAIRTAVEDVFTTLSNVVNVDVPAIRDSVDTLDSGANNTGTGTGPLSTVTDAQLLAELTNRLEGNTPTPAPVTQPPVFPVTPTPTPVTSTPVTDPTLPSFPTSAPNAGIPSQSTSQGSSVPASDARPVL
jgi:hypothetical protein